MASATPAAPRQRNFLRDGGWIVIAGVLIITVGMLYQVRLRLGADAPQKAVPLVGDGKTVGSYGFNLEQLAPGVNPNMILATGAPKDGVEAMVNPLHISVAENAALEGYHKYVLPTDRVIGVELGGVARAYPIQVLNWHQSVTDALHNTPITVVFDGQSDLASAFVPIVEGDSLNTLSSQNPDMGFGISGLAYRGHLLLYDRDADTASQSLWDPLLHSALAGPRAGTRLQPLPGEVAVLQWRDWLAAHPETTILARDENRAQDYKDDLFGPYMQTQQLPFGVQPQLDRVTLSELHLKQKSRGIGLLLDGAPVFIPHETVLDNAEFDAEGLGRWSVELQGRTLSLSARKVDVGFTPSTVWLDAGADVQVLAPVSLLFAWYATYPETRLLLKDGLVPAKVRRGDA